MRRFGALLLLTITLLAGCGGREAPVTGTSFLMDTIVEYKLYGKNAQAALQIF